MSIPIPAASVTPIIDKAQFACRIWITQLGIGFPEQGRVYLDAAALLERIAGAMTTDLANSQWEGQAASRSAAQGLAQRNATVELEGIDKAVAVVIEAQAANVMVARNTVAATSAELDSMKQVAAALHNSGQVTAATTCEVAAARVADVKNRVALSILADSTQGHTAMVSNLNRRLAGIVARLIEGSSASGDVLPPVNIDSISTLRNAASTLRVDTPSLIQNAVFKKMTSKWLQRPTEMVAKVSARVWRSHGSYTAAFNDQLQIFEIRRAEVMQKLQVAVASQAATLENAAVHFTEVDTDWDLSFL